MPIWTSVDSTSINDEPSSDEAKEGIEGENKEDGIEEQENQVNSANDDSTAET